jgi:hypothetical protein
MPTVTPTPTSTATPTVSPTPTATPTPTAMPPALRVLPNHTHYVDGFGVLHIVGEVENRSGSDVGGVVVGVMLLGEGGALVETGLGETYVERLVAGDKTCFHVSLPEPADWVSYAFEAPTYAPVEGAAPELMVVNDSGSYQVPLGWYLIDGEVRNDHGAAVSRVSAAGTVYHPSGDVLGCKGATVPDPNLDPGEAGVFEVVFIGRDYRRVVAYRVQADGKPEQR